MLFDHRLGRHFDFGPGHGFRVFVDHLHLESAVDHAARWRYAGDDRSSSDNQKDKICRLDNVGCSERDAELMARKGGCIGRGRVRG